MKTKLLKAEDGKFYHYGKIYAKQVRVREEWVEHWTLVTYEEAKEDKTGVKIGQFIHLIKENL